MKFKKFLLVLSITILLVVPIKCYKFELNITDWITNFHGRVSDECALQISASQESLAWTEMVDATSKSLNGLLSLSLFHLGDFDECYSILEDSSAGTISGKYCLGSMPYNVGLELNETLVTNNQVVNSSVRFPSGELLFPWVHVTSSLASMFSIQPKLDNNLWTTIKVGICLPGGCSAIDATNFTTNVIEFTSDYCYSKDTEPELTTGAIATIAVICIFGGITVLATIYDVILYSKKSKPPHPLFVAFSVFTNGRKLIFSSTNPDQLLCLNGIKSVSMMWVTIGHVYMLLKLAPLNNLVEFQKWTSNPINMYIMGTTLAVDTFFMAGGLLTTYTFLKAADKGIKLNLPLYYLHRYIRLTPALGIMILITRNLPIYLGSGPLWGQVDNVIMEPCRTYWWTHLLYIQNYYHKDLCISQSWYLAIDMQLFVLSPLVLIPLKRRPKPTLYFLMVLIVIGAVVDFVITNVTGIQSLLSLEKHDVYIWEYYYPLHARYNTYLIGMIFGYFIHKYKTNGEKSTLTVCHALVLWLIVSIGLVACVFAGHEPFAGEYNLWSNCFYLALNRPAWAISVGGVAYLCITGNGGPINLFLSRSTFQFLSKLCYTMYLVHYLYISLRYAAIKTPIQFDNFTIMFNFWGNFIYVLIISSVVCLIFESPMIAIENFLLATMRKKTKPHKPPVS